MKCQICQDEIGECKGLAGVIYCDKCASKLESLEVEHKPTIRVPFMKFSYTCKHCGCPSQTLIECSSCFHLRTEIERFPSLAYKFLLELTSPDRKKLIRELASEEDSKEKEELKSRVHEIMKRVDGLLEILR